MLHFDQATSLEHPLFVVTVIDRFHCSTSEVPPREFMIKVVSDYAVCPALSGMMLVMGGTQHICVCMFTVHAVHNSSTSHWMLCASVPILKQ